MGLNEKLYFKSRRVVGAGHESVPVPVKAPDKKSPAERELMALALKRNANLRALVNLSEDEIHRLIDAAWREKIPAGTNIIEEGDEGDYFYVVQAGASEIEWLAPHAADSHHLPTKKQSVRQHNRKWNRRMRVACACAGNPRSGAPTPYIDSPPSPR